ncbi:MAG: ABC transporter ATP-binding protein [Elusimicrobia bacterium]|nr:ABC transporter ATP-binding protein [Elusimicrobiota bacterium]
MRTLLKTEGLVFSYGREPLIKDLSFEILKGDLLWVLGPNGAGKSTLIKLLTGYLKPASGSIRLEGRELGLIPVTELAKTLAYVPSEIHLPYEFSVLETVLLGRAPHAGWWRDYSKEDRAAASSALEETGVAAFSARPVNSLSSGERQLVFIAQALAQNPKLLFLDEPTSHLDVKYTVEILALLKKLAVERRLGVCLVSHDISLAAASASRLLILKKGGGNLFGKPENLLKSSILAGIYALKEESVRLFLGAAAERPPYARSHTP